MNTRIILLSLLLLLLVSPCSAMGSSPEPEGHVPMQHLMPSEVDPEYQELLRRRDAAANLEERRRAEIAIERYSIMYMGNVSSERTSQAYKLEKIMKNTDLDYAFLKEIDSIPPPYPPNSPYQIGDLKYVPGKFKIYKFIAEYMGVSKFHPEPILFHDLLVIKTNYTNKILDAYHYTLEWTDSPSLDLYHSTGEYVYLENGLKIDKLKLFNAERGALEETGSLEF